MYWNLIAQATGGGTPASGNPMGSLFFTVIVPFAGIFLIFYFLMIRPQRKTEKERQAMLKALKKNDKVVTIGGIHGVVANVGEKKVVLKIDESKDVRVNFSRSAIARVVARDEEEDTKEG